MQTADFTLRKLEKAQDTDTRETETASGESLFGRGVLVKEGGIERSGSVATRSKRSTLCLVFYSSSFLCSLAWERQFFDKPKGEKRRHIDTACVPGV